jgi:hypothetical protein
MMNTDVLNWIKELMIGMCVAEESVRRMYFGMNPEPMILYATQVIAMGIHKSNPTVKTCAGGARN